MEQADKIKQSREEQINQEAQIGEIRATNYMRGEKPQNHVVVKYFSFREFGIGMREEGPVTTCACSRVLGTVYGPVLGCAGGVFFRDFV